MKNTFKSRTRLVPLLALPLGLLTLSLNRPAQAHGKEKHTKTTFKSMKGKIGSKSTKGTKMGSKPMKGMKMGSKTTTKKPMGGMKMDGKMGGMKGM